MARLPLRDYEIGTTIGFIKIHRSIMGKGWYKKPDYAHLFMHLILKAQFAIGETWFNGDITKLMAGQFVTGRKKLSEETGINESKVERILKCFEIEQQIEQVKSATSRLITIINWDRWQISEQDNEQRVNNERTTDEHYNKKYKNIENEKKEELPAQKKVKWNTNPSEKEIQDLALSDLEIQNCREFIYRIKKLELTSERINDFWMAFKIQQFTGAKFYQTHSDCIGHFRDWLKFRDADFLTTPPQINGSKQHKADERTAAILNQAEKGR
jgi:hypothetical protein